MIRINLLPVREAQRKERLRSQISILVLSAIAVSLVCGGIYFTTSMKISAKQEENAQVQRQINDLKKKIGKVDTLKRLKADLEKKLKVLAQLKANRKGPVHLMDQLSLSLPEKLWLEKYSKKGNRINIEGVGLSEPIVADFMRKLEGSPYYKGVELEVTSQKKQKGGLKVYNFKIKANPEDPEAKKKTDSAQKAKKK